MMKMVSDDSALFCNMFNIAQLDYFYCISNSTLISTKQKILLFMFKYIRGCLPKLFNNYYIQNVDIHSHVTRHQHRLYTHKCRTSAAQKAIRCGLVLFYGMNFQVKYVLMSVLHVINE